MKNKALIDIQHELKAPKNQFNKFGGYNYRSCEDILEAVKPLLKKHGAALVISDSIIEVGGGRVYVQATATLTAGEDDVVVTAFAREPIARKGMDDSQITGASSSYARKYALNGLFLIDDTKDADATNQHGKDEKLDDDLLICIKNAESLDELKRIWNEECEKDSRYIPAINKKKEEL